MNREYTLKNGNLEPKETGSLIIPDEALYFIVSRYLENKNEAGSEAVVVGIKPDTVEEVVRLFVEWASLNGYINNNMLVIGVEKIK